MRCLKIPTANVNPVNHEEKYIQNPTSVKVKQLYYFSTKVKAQNMLYLVCLNCDKQKCKMWFYGNICWNYFFLTLHHSDWVTGKRGRRNSVGSLDSTIEVSLSGAGLKAC